MSRRAHNNRRDGSVNANAHLIGSEVSVVQKQDQGTGRLTQGIISEILTNSAYHPRGIKVRLVDGTVGRISDGSERTESYSAMDDTAPAPPRRSLADFMLPVAPVPSQQSRTIDPPSAETAAEWACPACTFVNSGLLHECELCQTARP
jgi:uncharacterized repeat protein (TIGR03833 family)